MTPIGYFCLLIFASITTLNLTDFPVEIPKEMDALWASQGQLVQVRGFWYPISSEQGILASTPHLKSCCLQASSKLLVKGPFASFSTQKVIMLEGIFKIEPLYNSKGEQIQLYVLEKAQEVQSSTSYRLFSIVGLLGVFLGLVYYLKERFCC